MAKLNGQQIRERARAIVAESPGGIRFGELKEKISAESPLGSKPSSNFAFANRLVRMRV